MQDFYDALQRNYDITKDQTFAGQINVGVGDTKSLLGMLQDKIQGSAGVTPDVTRKAFEDLFNAMGKGLNGLKK